MCIRDRYAAVLYERVLLCKRRDQVDEALALGYECLDSFRRVGSLRWEALIKTQLGLLHQAKQDRQQAVALLNDCLLYTSPSPRNRTRSRMPSSA